MISMNAYDYIKKALPENKQKRLIDWRREDAVQKLEKPTDIGRARTLGYKAKKGVIVYRVRVKRGGRQNSKQTKGRKSKRRSPRKTLKMNYRWVCEMRAAKKHPNLEILNSYKVGQDGKSYFYEVIMIDPSRPEIKNDSNLSWIGKPENKNRVFRGLTSAGKKSRVLRTKSREMKVRPSLRARGRKGK